MLKAFVEKIVDMAEVQRLSIGDHTWTSKSIFPMEIPIVMPLNVSTLKAMAEYISACMHSENADPAAGMVHIESHTTVNLYSCLDKWNRRQKYISAFAILPDIKLNHFIPLEDFIIMLQACFVQSTETEQILKVVGNLKDESVRQFNDDGVSQAVTAKTGVASLETVKVPNPVILKPYRTFIEIENQPESKFVFRIKQSNGPPVCALFEADGGAWKIDAIDVVAAHLRDLLGNDKIIILS